MEVALEAGAEDVITDEDGAIEVLTAPADFEAVKNALEAAGLKPRTGRGDHAPENTIELAGDDAARMQKLLDVLEDLDDVQEVFHNAADQNESPLSQMNQYSSLAAVAANTRWPGSWPVAQGARRSMWRPATAARRSGSESGKPAPSPTCALCANGRRPKRSAHGGRPRRAAGRRRGGRVPRPRPAHLRPHQGRRAAGKLQGLLQGLHARHGIPTADYDTFTDPARPTPMWTAWARPSSSRPMAWRPARAWWWP
jgi:hypothetical protein